MNDRSEKRKATLIPQATLYSGNARRKHQVTNRSEDIRNLSKTD